MKNMITLKKKSDPGKFAVPCTVEPSKESFTFVDCSQRNSGEIVKALKVQIGNALVRVDFHVLDIKLNWNSSLLFKRAFLSTVGAVCNMQTNQLCLTLIDPHVYYNPIPSTLHRSKRTPRHRSKVPVGEKYFMTRLLQLPASRFPPPGSRSLPPASRSLSPGLGPASGFRLPGRV
ncbi:hypothetical protein F2Q68_00004809 [Brassica cretica]|uniref:Uncharacterized protein n=1 Tax=Brassica cretica TaxID=69181 RepID=A0A8S9JGD9_BRACR|nr:hypothetical protein F2Q68_00004809 [Brassica cretica]